MHAKHSSNQHFLNREPQAGGMLCTVSVFGVSVGQEVWGWVAWREKWEQGGGQGEEAWGRKRGLLDLHNASTGGDVSHLRVNQDNMLIF